MHDLARITLRLPKDVHEWLTKRADYNLGSLNSEIVRALRDQMSAENRPPA